MIEPERGDRLTVEFELDESRSAQTRVEPGAELEARHSVVHTDDAPQRVVVDENERVEIDGQLGGGLDFALDGVGVEVGMKLRVALNGAERVAQFRRLIARKTVDALELAVELLQKETLFDSRAVVARLCGMEDTCAQEREAGSAIHGPLQHLEPVDLAFGRACRPGQIEGCLHGAEVAA